MACRGRPGSISQKRSDQWTDAGGGTPFAGGISLAVGQKYTWKPTTWRPPPVQSVEVTCKHLADPDPTNDSQSVITGNQIGCYAPKCAAVAITSQPQSVTVTNYEQAVFAVGGQTRRDPAGRG